MRTLICCLMLFVWVGVAEARRPETPPPPPSPPIEPVIVPVPPPVPLPPTPIGPAVTVMAPGSTISVAVTNGPGGQFDWLGLFAVGAADEPSALLDWKRLTGTKYDAIPLGTGGVQGTITSAVVAFAIPTTCAAQPCEVRFFKDKTYIRLATSAPFGRPSTAPPVTPIETTVAVVVRDPNGVAIYGTMGGALIGTQPGGAQGTLTVTIPEPTTSDGRAWWQIRFPSGPSGWVVCNVCVVATP
jgi:hypothetical protein